jgi:hypothetical protein
MMHPKAIEKQHALLKDNRGNPAALIRWYNEGAGGKISWGDDGDFMQCVNVASDYMDDDQAKGF